MALPKITIEFAAGRLGRIEESADGLLALCCGAETVGGTFLPGTPYRIYSLSDLFNLGITEETTDNRKLYKHVKEFYTAAPEGTPLIVYGYDKSKSFTSLCDKDTGELAVLLRSLKGELRGIVLAADPETEDDEAEEGVTADVLTAVAKAQELAEWAARQLYAPVFVALEGRKYSGAANLKDFSDGTANRVCIVLGDTEKGSTGSAMGLFAGRVAASPVQRNIGRVRDGAISTDTMYLGNDAIEDVLSDITTIYDKGYICPRIYAGLAGYYWTDDRLCVAITDDYANLANRRVIDKAYRIVYETLLENMLDEIYLNEDGTMQNAVIKSWQSQVENAIKTRMTAQGELSADVTKDESGCDCYIDPAQKVLASSEIKVSVGVRPFGYSRYITVTLGFNVTQS